KRRLEDVEGSVAELVVRELNLLQRRFLVNDHEGAGVRFRAHRVVDQAGAQHLVGGQQVRQLANVPAGGAVHAAAAALKSGRIGENGHLHRQLGGVCKRGDLPGVLVVRFSKDSLGVRVSI